MRLSIVQKISVLTILLVVVTAGVVSSLFYQEQKDLLVQQALDGFSNQIQDYGHALQNHINDLHADTRLLAKVPPIQGYLRAAKNQGVDVAGNSTQEQWVQRLETIFTVVLEAKPAYLMARFLDAKGVELVRVDREKGILKVVPGDQLQSKALRDYVVEAMKLPEGGIYLSEINLNREFGEVVKPYEKVLRSAIPVYDELNGELSGLVVLTLDIGIRIGEIETSVPEDGRNIYITNDKGDYLLHPDRQKIFGFDLGEKHRIQDDFPSMYSLFDKTGNMESLNLLPEDTLSNQAAVFRKFKFDPKNPDRFFLIAVTEPYEKIVSEVLSTLNDVLGTAIILILIAALFSILLSQRLARPIKQMTKAVGDYGVKRGEIINLPLSQGDEIGTLAQSFQLMAEQVENAESSLRDLNQDLENLVDERTRELQRSEVRQKVIVENIVDGLISIDEQGIVKDFNRAAENIFGYSAKEVLGENINMLIPRPIASMHDHYLKKYLETGEAGIIGVGREVEGQRKDGSVFPMDLAINEMWFGDQRFYSGIVRDITERKYVEKMKNEFISTVSHELRTPLTSIRGAIGLLQGGVVGNLPDKAKEMITIAGNNTERLLAIINDILDIQKIESGRMSFKNEFLLLMPFLEQAVEDHAAYGEQFNVSFVITESISGASVFYDKVRLMQVVGNLLSNAAKFSPAGAVVQLTVTKPRERTVRISVIDKGPGIPEEARASLFDQFTQVDSSDTREKGGTGLGLAISKAIIETLGGYIGVNSVVGRGSTFFVDIPEYREIHANQGDDKDSEGDSLCLHENHAGNNALSPRREKEILLVEDDPVTANLIQKMLADSGYESEIAYNTNEARDKIQQAKTPFRLMLLDLLLPDESGIDFLVSVRDDPSNREMSVVVLSVQADAIKEEVDVSGLGIYDCISKPINNDRLIETVQALTPVDRILEVLHVEDEPDVHSVVGHILNKYCNITKAYSLSESRKLLLDGKYDLVLLDIGLPDGSGLELIENIKSCPYTPKVVVFSAHDVPENFAHMIDAALLKSNASNADLLKIITDSI